MVAISNEMQTHNWLEMISSKCVYFSFHGIPAGRSMDNVLLIMDFMVDFTLCPFLPNPNICTCTSLISDSIEVPDQSKPNGTVEQLTKISIPF